MEIMRPSLIKYAWLSVATAVTTIILKLGAFWITDSVGLLSDALEGSVNLVAALVALLSLRIAARPPDDSHEYGHDKVEYFSSGTEGTLILLASISIAATSINRLLHPQPLQQIGVGLVISLIAAGMNAIVGQILIRTGKTHDSITLEADGHHLMSDVWTSVGVAVGVSAAVFTGFEWLDPVVALLVGLRIGWAGIQLMRRSARGLMDYTLPAEERMRVEEILNRYAASHEVDWHALRTRQAGARRFVSVHLLVPGRWTVQQAHDFSEQVETDLRQMLPRISVLTHIEPYGDPVSDQDVLLDRVNIGAEVDEAAN